MLFKNSAEIFGLKVNKLVVFTILICIAGLALRIYSLDFFEFKMDQARAVLSGDFVLAEKFSITHGMMTTVGIPNPPGFYWLLGLLAVFGQGPVFLASFFLCFSCLLPFAIYFTFKRYLEQETLLVAVILSVASPMLIVLSCNIWAQCAIPLFTVFVIWSLMRFIEKSKDVYWILAVIVALFAGSIHLSGMFLLPVIAFTVLKKRPSITAWIVSAVAGMMIYGGWIFFLIKYWNWKLLPTQYNYLDNLWFSIQSILISPTNFFMLFYFPNDFLKITSFYAGSINACFLLVLGSIPVWIFFFFGFAAYLKAAKSNLKKAVAFQLDNPITVQISILISLFVPLAYSIMGTRIEVFYMLVSMPAFLIVCGYGFSRLKIKSIKYGLLVLFSSATLLNSGLFLRYIDYSGGHPEEYGPSYGLLKGIAYDIDNIRGNNAVNLKIMVTGKARKKFDPLPIKYVFLRFMNSKGMPLYLEVFWDDKSMRFGYNLSSTMPESMRMELKKRQKMK
jgi:hypothetical protein